MAGRNKRRFSYLPLVPLAPAAVVVVGALLAVIITVLGVSDLRRTSDEHALEKVILADDDLLHLVEDVLHQRGGFGVFGRIHGA